MKQKLIYFLSLSLFGGFLFYFFGKNPDLLTQIKSISPVILFGLFCLYTTLLAINGYFLKIITQPFGITIKNHFWLSATTSLLNLVTPFRGGAVFRGWYLKKKYNLDLKDIFITIAGSYPIIFFVNSFLGLLLLTYEASMGNVLPLWGWIFFGGVFVGTLLLFFIPEIKHKKLRKLNLLIQGWHKITQNKSLLLSSFFLYFLFSFISAIPIFLLLLAIDIDTSFYKAFIISVFSIFSVLINITPAGLGITEVFLVIGGSLIGLSVETMLFISIIQRGIMIITNLFWGGLGKIILLRDINEKKV